MEQEFNDDPQRMKREDLPNKGVTRRSFLRNVSLTGIGYAFLPISFGDPVQENVAPGQVAHPESSLLTINMDVNKKKHKVLIDSRSTLLDTLREQLNLKGTKKGCDHGQCGACTVMLNDKRVNSCLVLAACCNGAEVTTIEGLADGDRLHPMQEAFIKHDAFQCGYCTPGQICSAIGLLAEGHATTIEEVSELMSGNICRCGAYQNINNAIMEVNKL